MTMSQYLGRGATSRGRMTITPSLTTIVSDVPYLKDPNDKEAVIQGIINLQNALKNVANLTWTYPNASISARDYVNNVSLPPFTLPPTNLKPPSSLHTLTQTLPKNRW
jgi:cellobiose dehydrogenase (acceptor)